MININKGLLIKIGVVTGSALAGAFGMKVGETIAAKALAKKQAKLATSAKEEEVEVKDITPAEEAE